MSAEYTTQRTGSQWGFAELIFAAYEPSPSRL